MSYQGESVNEYMRTLPLWFRTWVLWKRFKRRIR